MLKKNKQAKSYTKKDLIKAVTTDVGINEEHAKKVVDLFFNTIKQGLLEDSIVKISRFGNFKIRHKKERIGRNPKNMEDAIISARKTVSFQLSEFLRNKLNK